MDSSLIELSKYRYQRSKEIIEDAKLLARDKSFSSSVNRSYYAIFHALRAITALDGFDSSKHSGIIAYINRKLDLSNIDYTNEELYENLLRILQILGRERRIIEKKRIIPQKITIE